MSAIFEKFESVAAAGPEVDVAKMLASAEDMVFNQPKDFLKGLETGPLDRSMRQEFQQNEGGKWYSDFVYVVDCSAISVPDADKDAPLRKAAAERYAEIGLPAGAIRRRDEGHEGMKLEHFCEHQDAIEAELTVAEVAGFRLYSGPPYEPLNGALRSRNIEPWKTTISVINSGVLKVSMLAKTSLRVYRGIKEGEHKGRDGKMQMRPKLPDYFFNGEFPGGVERALMSTTLDAKVALDYTGDGPGTIFSIKYSAGTRAASLQFASQFPHEQEYLFPPGVMIEPKCRSLQMCGNKRLVLVNVSASTNRPDTSAILTPDTVPEGKRSVSFLHAPPAQAVQPTSSSSPSAAAASSADDAPPVAPVDVALLRQKSSGSLRRLLGAEQWLSKSGKTMSGKSLSAKVKSMDDSSLRSWYERMMTRLGRRAAPAANSGVEPAAGSTSRDRGDSAESAADDAELQTSLRELLQGLKLKPKALDDALANALAWCRAEGHDDLDDIKELRLEGVLVDAMCLKKGKADVLKQRLAEARAAAPPLGKQMSGRL